MHTAVTNKTSSASSPTNVGSLGGSTVISGASDPSPEHLHMKVVPSAILSSSAAFPFSGSQKLLLSTGGPHVAAKTICLQFTTQR